jgi:hypothetical protein
MIMMRKPMKALVATGALALATVSCAGAVLATATPASADVLVNYDGGTIHLGQSMRVGVFLPAVQRRPERLLGRRMERLSAQVDFHPQRLRVSHRLEDVVGQAAEARQVSHGLQRRRHQGNVLHRSEVGSITPEMGFLSRGPQQ